VQPFRFTSPSDQVVCAFCLNHLGATKAERRDTDHIAMWAELFADEVDAHQAFAADTRETIEANETHIRELTARVTELTNTIASEFAQSPSSETRAMLDSEVVKRADRATTLVNRRLDRAMAVIWHLDRLHHDDETRPGTCVCGIASARCAEQKMISVERSELLSWERKNIALHQHGERHALPSDHPALG
jgi:hypothetical protein